MTPSSDVSIKSARLASANRMSTSIFQGAIAVLGVLVVEEYEARALPSLYLVVLGWGTASPEESIIATDAFYPDRMLTVRASNSSI